MFGAVKTENIPAMIVPMAGHKVTPARMPKAAGFGLGLPVQPGLPASMIYNHVPLPGNNKATLMRMIHES